MRERLPSRPALGPSPRRLAASVNNLGILLGELGQNGDALIAAQEATDIYRQLAAARPGIFLPNLAISLHNMAGHQAAVGRLELALECIEETITLYSTLVAERPEIYGADLKDSLSLKKWLEIETRDGRPIPDER